MARSVPLGEVRRLGDHALLVGVEDTRAAQELARAIGSSARPGLCEVVGGLSTVMVAFEPDTRDLHAAHQWLTALARSLPVSTGDTAGGRTVVIPCTFDGPDLGEVSQAAGTDVAAVIAMVTAHPLTVAMIGFSPGFAYLSGLPEALAHLPRRSRPRPSVPAGSVALANGHAAVYPTASPGGWQLIGRTDEILFDPGTPPYARLAPGDRVQFTAVEGGAAAAPSPQPPAPPRIDVALPARPTFVVEAPGVRTVLQDGGRRGVATIGVPAAGPADHHSFELANRLVGNPPDAAALEVTAHGPTLRCLADTYVAVVGASPTVTLQGREVATGQVIPVSAGHQVRVGPLRHGFRTYLSVAGGLVGARVLGSCATDQLCGLGPGPLVRDDQLWAGEPHLPLGDHLAVGTDEALEDGSPVSLRVVAGPHPEWFALGAFAALSSIRFSVAAESNRVGLRLRPTSPGRVVARAQGALSELDSQGMVTGAIQIPPDGDPVILLGDHATLGGYPVLAVVATVDHGRLGQSAPGASVVLVPVSHAQAAEAWRAHRHRATSAIVGHYPVATG